MVFEKYAAGMKMNLTRFLSLPHLKESMSPTDGHYVDAALSKMQRIRHVALNVPHWLAEIASLGGTQ